MLQCFLSKRFKKHFVWRYARTATIEKMLLIFYFLFVHAAARGGACTFTLKIVSILIKTAHVTIDLRSRHRINPQPTRFVSGKTNECRWRPQRYQVDPWSRRREVAHGVLRSSPKPKKRSIFFAVGEGLRICFLHTREQIFLDQTPGRRPRRITGRVVNTVTRWWVGAPNERTSFRIHDAVVGFVDR